MNTPQEFEPLGYWMGWERKNFGYFEAWVDSDGKVFTHAAEQKTSLTPSECIEVLNRLVEKGHHPKLERDGDEWWVCVNRFDSRDGSASAPTINQAVEQALLKLIEAEKGGI